MPKLQELVKLHKDDDFALIGINCGDDLEAYRKGLEKFGVTWLSAWQDGRSTLQRAYKVEGFPTYVLIDQEGKIVARGHGGMEERVAQLLSR